MKGLIVNSLGNADKKVRLIWWKTYFMYHVSYYALASYGFFLSSALQDDMALEKRQEAIDLVKKGLMMDMRSVSIKRTHL